MGRILFYANIIAPPKGNVNRFFSFSFLLFTFYIAELLLGVGKSADMFIFHKFAPATKKVEKEKFSKKCKKYYKIWKNLLTKRKKDDKIVNCIIIARIVGSRHFEADLYSSKLHKRTEKFASWHMISQERYNYGME